MITRPAKKIKKGKFHQQKLPGWTPDFRSRTTGRCFLINGIFMFGVSILILILEISVTDFTLDYTNCKSSLGTVCAEMLLTTFRNSTSNICQCIIHFRISQIIKAPAFFYYQIDNFYQNHRNYYESRDDKQLRGIASTTLSKKCEPFRYSDMNNKIAYAPCGLIANSLFNDTFQLLLSFDNVSIPVPWTNRNIAWKSDKTSKFGKLGSWANTVKPPNWKLSAIERNINAYSGDEELIVWMRPAALFNVRKLHRIIYSNSVPFNSGLPKGNYTLLIDYVYPVTIFHGRKSIYISSTSVLGGKNIYICYICLLVSVIHILIGLFLVTLDRYKIDVA